jgi:hypothetical protein
LFSPPTVSEALVAPLAKIGGAPPTPAGVATKKIGGMEFFDVHFSYIARLEVVPHRVQLFRSNWLRSLSAIDLIMSHRSTSCGPSVMITTFQESSCGTMEMARPVGHSQMSSISSLIADSSSSRVFAGFFKLFFHRAERDHRLCYPRERIVFEQWA